MPARSSYQPYTVVKGDTLSAIAARFGSSVSAIATASGISDPNKISVGQQLLVPVSTDDDLSEVTVNVRPIATSSPKMDPRATGLIPPTVSLQQYLAPFFEPPRLYFTLAAVAVVGYYLLAPKSRRNP